MIRRNLTNESYTFVYAFTFSSPMVVQKGSDGVAKPYWTQRRPIRLRTRMSVTAKYWGLPVRATKSRSGDFPSHRATDIQFGLYTHDRQAAMFLKNASIWCTEFCHSQFPIFLPGTITVTDEGDTIFQNVGNLLPKTRHTRTLSLFLRPTVHFNIPIPQLRRSVHTISYRLYQSSSWTNSNHK